MWPDNRTRTAVITQTTVPEDDWSEFLVYHSNAIVEEFDAAIEELENVLLSAEA